MICFRIYVVHDEVKDKNFELELSWVGESKYKFVKLPSISNQFQKIPYQINFRLSDKSIPAVKRDSVSRYLQVK